MYRYHVMNPVRFESDFKVTIQALGWGYNGRWLHAGRRRFRRLLVSNAAHA
jgi:hypothetical protein